MQQILVEYEVPDLVAFCSMTRFRESDTPFSDEQKPRYKPQN